MNIEDENVVLEVEYSDFNDEDQDTIEVTSNQFTLKNNNLEEVKVNVEITGLPSEYSSETIEVIIPAESTVPVYIKVNVPHDKDGGEDNIGQVTVKGAGEVLLGSVNLIQNTKSMLDLYNFKAEYVGKDDDSESDSFDGDDDFFELEKDVKLFTEMSLIFKIKNLIDKDYDLDLENIILTIDTNDDDFFDNDWEEEIDLEDLNAGAKDEYTFTFIISEEADAGDFTIDITLEGEDENGAEYKIEKELLLSLDRLKDDIRIIEVKTIPEEVTICDKDFILKVEVQNFGSKDQKYGALSIYNDELGINENVAAFEIEQYGDDDLWSYEFKKSITKSTKKGDYNIEINTYVDKDEQVDNEGYTLSIKECVEEEEEIVEETEDQGSKTEVITSTLDINENTVEDQTESETENTTPETEETQTDLITSSAVVETIEDSYSPEDFMIGIILVAIVMVLALIIVFFVVLLK